MSSDGKDHSLRRPVVLIIIDALGADICAEHSFDLRGSGGPFRLRTEFGFSQAALTSIMTGLRPQDHGLWMMYAFASERHPFGFIGQVPGMSDTERLWVRRAITWKLGRFEKVTAYYNLYDVPGDVLMHLDLPARKSLFSSRSVETADNLIDTALAFGLPVFVRDHNDPEEKAFKELNEELARGRGGFYLLYTAGLDAVMHSSGVGSSETAAKLEYYRHAIEEVKAACPDALVTVMGDHGMCDVVDKVDMISDIERAGPVKGKHYIPFYDSTMARFRLLDPESGPEIARILSGLDYGDLLGDEEIADLGVAFEDRRFGDLIFLMKPGSIILPSYMGRNPVSAMHGYHPDSSGMYSALFTDPDAGFDGSSITDVAGYVKSLLGKGVRQR